MKIGLIVPSFYPAVIYGGPIFSTKLFVEEIIKLNYNVEVLTTNINKGKKLNVINNKNILFNKNRKITITYFSVNKLFKNISFKLIYNLRSKIKNFDIVKIEDTFSVYVPISLLISVIYKKKIILSPRGVFSSYSLKKNYFLKYLWITLFIKPFCNKIIWHVTSSMEEKDIFNFFKKKIKTIIIPNGININTEIAENHNKQVVSIFNQQKEKKFKIILGIGRLDVIKRFDILISSFNNLDKEKYKLLIVGSDYGHKSFLQSLIKKNKLDDQVYLCGPIFGNEKALLYKSVDLVVLPSFSENFSNIVPESLIHGTPVLASNGTPWSSLEINNAGLQIEVNKKNLANNIVKILANRIKYSSVNCHNFGKQFSIKNSIYLYDKLFKI